MPTTDLDATLRLRGRALLPESATLVDALLRRWSEPHRSYHTTTHLAQVLDRIDEFAEPHHDHRTVALAAWYHDAVYDLPAGVIGNEESSAQLAVRDLVEPVGAGAAEEVARLVRITADHRMRSGDVDAELLCDADLAILAAADDEYHRYVVAIRQEYAFVPEPQFRTGRAAVLRGLLAQERLFRTARGSSLEDAARLNLARELGELTAT